MHELVCVDACEQPGEEGPCQGNFTRWYFDKEHQTCSQFNYGGCKPNKNNFLTELACQQKCLQPGRSKGKTTRSRVHLQQLDLQFYNFLLGTYACGVYLGVF